MLAGNALTGAKRLNDWNAWNGLISVMNGAKRLNDWNDWNWLLTKIDRAIYPIRYRSINGLRWADPGHSKFPIIAWKRQ
jgi:hypothetical protein